MAVVLATVIVHATYAGLLFHFPVPAAGHHDLGVFCRLDLKRFDRVCRRKEIPSPRLQMIMPTKSVVCTVMCAHPFFFSYEPEKGHLRRSLMTLLRALVLPQARMKEEHDVSHSERF